MRHKGVELSGHLSDMFRHRALNCGIYKISNPLTGRFYIGASTDLFRRLSQHISGLSHQRHHNRFIQLDWCLFGPTNFHVKVLLFCDKDQIFDYEKRLIEGLKPDYNDPPPVLGWSELRAPTFAVAMLRQMPDAVATQWIRKICAALKGCGFTSPEQAADWLKRQALAFESERLATR